MTESNIFTMPSLDPVPYNGDYQDEDNDEMDYSVLPLGPLIVMFTAYLVLKHASRRNYVSWLGLTDLYRHAKDWKFIFTQNGETGEDMENVNLR